MINNLIYLCGPHGSGKSTLAEKLKRKNARVLIPELFSRNVKFNIEDEEYRQVLKICSRAIENFEFLQIAKENPEKIVLGNRCLHDVLAYNWVYFNRGWIPKDTYERYNQYARDFFRQDNSEPFAIILNPEFEACKSHLEKRWLEKGKKWREEDLEYARLACEAYKRLEGMNNTMYIGHEIDLENREVESISEWLDEVYSRDFVCV